MRKPTAKEIVILNGCLEGLTADIRALTTEEPSHDVQGTTKVNLQVIRNILAKLETERD